MRGWKVNTKWQPAPIPSYEQIWAAAAAIRAEWSEAQRLRRRCPDVPHVEPAEAVHVGLPREVLEALCVDP